MLLDNRIPLDRDLLYSACKDQLQRTTSWTSCFLTLQDGSCVVAWLRIQQFDLHVLLTIVIPASSKASFVNMHPFITVCLSPGQDGIDCLAEITSDGGKELVVTAELLSRSSFTSLMDCAADEAADLVLDVPRISLETTLIIEKPVDIRNRTLVTMECPTDGGGVLTIRHRLIQKL